MMDKNIPIIVLGSGGHAKVLIETLRENQIPIVGVTSLTLNKNDDFLGLKVIVNDDDVNKYNQREILLVNGIGSLPGNTKRKELSALMRQKGYEFFSVIHPQSIISPSTDIKDGVQIMAGTVIQAGSCIGSDTIINTGSIIDHDCVIGNDCHVGPGSVLSGGVTIGDGTHIGTGSNIIQNIKIGKNVIIASGSSVFRDIDPDTKFIQKK